MGMSHPSLDTVTHTLHEPFLQHTITITSTCKSYDMIILGGLKEMCDTVT